MDLKFSFKQMDSSDGLRTFIREKSETLNKYFHGRISVNWSLCQERNNRIARCHVLGNNMNYHGEAATEDFKASIDEVLSRIETQIRKHKEIVKDHLHRNGHRAHVA